MNFFKEIIYLMNWKGIGRAAINKEFAPWVKQQVKPQVKQQKTELCTETAVLSDRLQNGPLGKEAETAERWLLESGKRKSPSGTEEMVSWKKEQNQALRKTMEILEWLSEQETVSVCTIFDEEYPVQLYDMKNQRPPVLYMKGEKADFQMLSEPMPAVIGGRWPCEQALREGPSFAARVAETAGTGIISGLARGCDRMGHEAAIKAGLVTVAVMPCGLDTIVPEINQDLAEQILEGAGCLLSEYPPGTPPAEYRYAERDRITAALSAGSIVIECEEKSGTMQTVQAAVSMGRPVACWLPESLPDMREDQSVGQRWTKSVEQRSEGFEGNRRMIKELNAHRICDEQSMRGFQKLLHDNWQQIHRTYSGAEELQTNRGDERHRIDSGAEELQTNRGDERHRIDSGAEELQTNSGDERHRIDSGAEELQTNSGGKEHRTDNGKNDIEEGEQLSFLTELES